MEHPKQLLRAMAIVGGRLWDGKKGQRRFYFADLPRHFGLVLLQHNCAVVGVTLRGAPLDTNAGLGLHSTLADGKVWYDLDAGGWHHRIDSYREYDGSEVGEYIIAAIQSKLAARGVAA